MESKFITETRKIKPESTSKPGRIWEFANQIYIFCPEFNKGVMFYDQSPSGAIARLTGSLPEGKFWSSEEKIVDWREEVNGKKIDNIPVTKKASYVTSEKKFAAGRPEEYGGGIGSFNAITIIVSKENFVNVLYQLEEENKKTNEDGYTIIDLNSIIFRYNPNINKVNPKEYPDNNTETETINYDENINLYTEYTEFNNKKKKH